jgi:lipoate---protein ligase
VSLQFTLVEQSGPAAELFAETDAALASVADQTRIVRVLTVTEPVVVLGSAQDASTLTNPIAGVEVICRRSGGGAVWLDGDAMVWVDLIIGRADPLWNADVGSSMWWVGDLFGRVLTSLGVPDATVHRGPMVRHELDRTVCWTGLGAGEVTSGTGGPKLVGIAQKRVRDGALFQVGVLLAESQFRLASLFGLDGASEATVRASERSIGPFGGVFAHSLERELTIL